MVNRQFKVIKNNKKNIVCVCVCMRPTTYKFCSVPAITDCQLWLYSRDTVFLNLTHPQATWGSVNLLSYYQTPSSRRQYTRVNARAPIISMYTHFLFLFDRISVGQIPCLLRTICLWAVLPLSDVLHGCQVGLWERTAKYEVFILSMPGWDCTAQHSIDEYSTRQWVE